MEKDRFVAELRRALLTEDEMAEILLDLTSTTLRVHDFAASGIKEADELLNEIRTETARHKEVVGDLIARLTGGDRNG